MAIDRLSSTAALIAALRDNVIARGGASRRTERTNQPLADVASARYAPSMVQLRGQLKGIAEGVDLGDSAAVHQARTRFIRTILLWEFGPELREHADWKPLMQGIESALDQGGAAGIETFIDILKRLQSEIAR